MQKDKQLDHQHLLINQLLAQIRSSKIDMRRVIRDMNIDYYDLSEENRRIMLQKLIASIKSTEQGNQMLVNLKAQLHQKLEDTNYSLTRKQTYLIDCYREATAFPITKQRQGLAFNLEPFSGKDIGRQLRRVIWSRIFNGDRLRMKFSKLDREITPFKVQDQLKISLEKICLQHKATLKDNQIQIALRIVEYFIKSQGKLPQKYHFYLAVTCVDLYSFTQSSKIVDVGAVALGLIQLLNFYDQQRDARLMNIKKALQLVDSDTYSFIQANFLSSKDSNGVRELLQSFELFRLTAGSYYLSLQTTQFIIDQLIIRKKCKLDIYTLFAIMILIISDEFQKKILGQASLKDLILKARDIVKKEEYIEAFNVIYSGIPAFFSPDNLIDHPNNRLLAQMLAFQPKDTESEEVEEETDFVISVGMPARIGRKQ